MANDKKLIDELLDRNREKPLKKLYWASGAKPLPACPNCGELVYTNRGTFCVFCGQRIDKQNWEFWKRGQNNG